jgi:hypothetical protein
VTMEEPPPAAVPVKKGQSGSSKKKRWIFQLQASAYRRDHWIFSVKDSTAYNGSFFVQLIISCCLYVLFKLLSLVVYLNKKNYYFDLFV